MYSLADVLFLGRFFFQEQILKFNVLLCKRIDAARAANAAVPSSFLEDAREGAGSSLASSVTYREQTTWGLG